MLPDVCFAWKRLKWKKTVFFTFLLAKQTIHLTNTSLSVPKLFIWKLYEANIVKSSVNAQFKGYKKWNFDYLCTDKQIFSNQNGVGRFTPLTDPFRLVSCRAIQWPIHTMYYIELALAISHYCTISNKYYLSIIWMINHFSPQ